MKQERIKKIKEIFEVNNYILKTSEMRNHGISSRDIAKLIALDYLIRIRTGYFGWKSEYFNLNDYEIVQRIIPEGVISVFTAADIHGLTTMNYTKISVTISSKKLKPVLPDYPPIELFYISEQNLNLGATNFLYEGTSIRIYNRERTVCDYFNYIDRTGKDMAIEVLKNYLNSGEKNLQLLFDYARKLRVIKYIKPYVEVLI